jgi:Fe-S-cluster containining protein
MNKKNKNKKIQFPKNKTKRISLSKKLNNIYNSVNLETTCKGRCECCNVAMPQMNYCEFSQLLSKIWSTSNNKDKLNLLCVSIEYFFRNEFEKWGKEALIKPCMLLDENKKCRFYEDRPLSCRLYGLWPEKLYNNRVDRFEKAYEGLLTRDELPLNTQCPFVTRLDDSVEITEEVIDNLFDQLNSLDQKMAYFTDAQVEQKENYRTFHDWLLWTFLGEENLVALTRFMLGANRKILEEQIDQFVKIWTKNLTNNVPKMKLVDSVEEEIEEPNGNSDKKKS